MEWCEVQSGKYLIKSLSADTFPGALKVIKDAFCQDEPVSIATGVNLNPQAAEELLELCADAALDGVSLVAVEAKTGNVVGVSFNKLQVRPTGDSAKTFFDVFAEERCTQDPSRALVQFMADVDAKFDLFNAYNSDCSLEIMLLATLKEHRKQSIAFNLCKTTLELAKTIKNGPICKIRVEDLGPKYATMQNRDVSSLKPTFCQVIATARGTQIIAKRLNFDVHLTLSYKDFTYKGKKYSETLGNLVDSCMLLGKDLK